MDGPPEMRKAPGKGPNAESLQDGTAAATNAYTDLDVVAKVEKNNRETIFIRRGSYKGHAFIDLRVFVVGKDGEPVATKKGVALAPDKLPALIAALQGALA
jgi:hypothetical protein